MLTWGDKLLLWVFFWFVVIAAGAIIYILYLFPVALFVSLFVTAIMTAAVIGERLDERRSTQRHKSTFGR